ncbi:MAG: hypothetical protein AAFO75_14315, partial [Pseudomonadota bacterium]
MSKPLPARAISASPTNRRPFTACLALLAIAVQVVLTSVHVVAGMAGDGRAGVGLAGAVGDGAIAGSFANSATVYCLNSPSQPSDNTSRSDDGSNAPPAQHAVTVCPLCATGPAHCASTGPPLLFAVL